MRRWLVKLIGVELDEEDLGTLFPEDQKEAAEELRRDFEEDVNESLIGRREPEFEVVLVEIKEVKE